LSQAGQLAVFHRSHPQLADAPTAYCHTSLIVSQLRGGIIPELFLAANFF